MPTGFEAPCAVRALGWTTLASVLVVGTLVAHASPALAAEGVGTAAGVVGGDAPLKPPELLSDSPATYPEALKAEALEGDVELEIQVDDEGAVVQSKVVRHAHPLFEAAALEAAAELQFKPATLDGRPVPVRMPFVYRFLAPHPAESSDVPAPPKRLLGMLTGVVRSRGNRHPIPGASLASDGGAAVQTDGEGRFRMDVPVDGPVRLEVRASGYEPRHFEERVAPAQSVEVVYGLDPLRVNAYETVVHGERLRTEVARVSLQAQELREVPGTMGDPFRVVMLMPGVGSMLSGLAYPVVRGAAPASTGTFLDGVRVPVLFHLFLGPAVIHPDFIEGIDFYPGAPPSQYGRLLGGVIEGRTATSRDDRVHGTVYADLINAGGLVEVPIPSTGTSVTLAGRYSYTPWLLALSANAGSKSHADPSYVLDFWDYQGRIEQKVAGGRLRLFAFGSSDDMGTESSDPTVAAARQTVLFHRVDARYEHPLLGGEIEAGATWGIDSLGFHSQRIDTSHSDFNLNELSWAARMSWSVPLGKGFELRIGGDLDHRAANVKVGSDSIVVPRSVRIDQSVAVGTFLGGWAALVWRGHGWTVVPGVRVDGYHLVPGVQRVTAEPRLTVRKEITDAFAWKGGAGLYHQAPSTLIQMPVVDTAGLVYGLQEGAQIDVGFEWKVLRGLELSVDGYFNPLMRTVELNPFDPKAHASSTPFDSGSIPQADQIFDSRDVTSHGYAYGVEVLLRHPLGGRWFGWLSYSLQRSTRYARFSRYDAYGTAVGEGAGYLPYAFDQTHIFNAVLSYQLPAGWTLGAVFHFNTGRPEDGVMTSSTMREGSLSSRPLWVLVSRDQAHRLPSFFRVDVRLAKTWTFDTFTLDAYLDLLNASMQSETVGFSYVGGVYRGGGALTKSAVGVPVILPILGVKAAY